MCVTIMSDSLKHNAISSNHITGLISKFGNKWQKMQYILIIQVRHDNV